MSLNVYHVYPSAFNPKYNIFKPKLPIIYENYNKDYFLKYKQTKLEPIIEVSEKSVKITYV